VFKAIGAGIGAWMDAYHVNARLRSLGNILETVLWYAVLLVLYQLLLNSLLVGSRDNAEMGRAYVAEARATVRALESEQAPPQELAGAQERLQEAEKELTDYEVLLANDERLLGFPLIVRESPFQLLLLFLGAVLPGLTLIATGKAPIHLALSIPQTLNIQKQDEVNEKETTDQRLYRLIASSKKKEASASSLALLLLIVGILTAVSGVFFFYIETSASRAGAPITPGTDLATLFVTDLFEALPRIGVLIFVEIIALFFLKQYQAMREEHRYFEAIRRSREDTALLLKYLETATPAPAAEKLIEQGVFYSSPGVLKSGETTAFVEERKISKDEMNVIADMYKTTISQIRSGS